MRRFVASVLTATLMISLLPAVAARADTIDQDPPKEISGSYTVGDKDATTFSYTVKSIKGAEYRMDDGDWQDGNTFTGIEPLSSHTFYVRMKGDAEHNPSDEVASEVIKFLKLDRTGTPDLDYTVTGTSGNRTIVIKKVTGAEYSFDGGYTWAGNANSNILQGINNKSVNIAIRYAETDTLNASSAVKKTVDTAIADQDAPADFTLHYRWNADGGTLTAIIPEVAGCEYSFDGKHWYRSNIKTDCEPGTLYTGYIRYKAANGQPASDYNYDTRRSPSLQSNDTEYDISTSKSKGGYITVLPETAEPGDKITVTIDPNYGYKLDTFLVLKDGKTKITTKKVMESVYTFIMPVGDVDVLATFEKKTVTPTPQPTPDKDPSQGDLPFTDIVNTAWYYHAVKYCYDNDIMSGYSNKLFFPNDRVTRAQVAAVLYNMENPGKKYSQVFWDVPNNTWYAQAVNWAASKGIVAGYGGGKFGPDDQVTREQFVSILNKYANYKGYNTNRTTDITIYRDYYAVSSWARQTMAWSVASDVLHGTDYHKLNPQGTTTRAEMATMMMNFDLGVVK